MAKTFHLTIAKVGETLFEGEARLLTVPGVDGIFTVLAGHEALVSELASGVLHIEEEGGEKREFPVTGGVVEVSSNQATILL